MIGKKNLDRIFAICLAVVYGGLIIGGIPVFWFKGNFWLYLFFLTVVCGLLYIVGKWIRARVTPTVRFQSAVRNFEEEPKRSITGWIRKGAASLL
jgi:hypothetical protein